MRLLDYGVRNAAPIHIALDQQQVRIEELQLVGDGTQLRVSGSIGLRDERIALKASGDANLGILQGFFPGSVRGSGHAELDRRDGRAHAPAAVLRKRDDHQRPHSPLLAAQRARRHQRHDLLRRGRHPPGQCVGDARRRRRCDSAAASDSTATSPASWTSPSAARTCGCAIRRASGRSSMPTSSVRGAFKAPTLGGTVTVKSAVWNRRIDTPGSLFDLAPRRARRGAWAAADRSRRRRCRCGSTCRSSCRRRCGWRTTSRGWSPAPISRCAAPTIARCCSVTPTSSAARSRSRGAGTASPAASSTSPTRRRSSRSSTSKPKPTCA